MQSATTKRACPSSARGRLPLVTSMKLGTESRARRGTGNGIGLRPKRSRAGRRWKEDGVEGQGGGVDQERLFTAQVAGGLDIGNEVGREEVEAHRGEAHHKMTCTMRSRFSRKASRTGLNPWSGQPGLVDASLSTVRLRIQRRIGPAAGRQERQAPAPRHQGFVGHRLAEDEDHRAGDDGGQRGGGDGDVEPEPAVVDGACSKTNDGAPTDSPPAEKPWMRRQRTREQAPRRRSGRRWEEPHQGGRPADGDERDGQDPAPADPVAKRPEEQAADGTDTKATPNVAKVASMAATGSLPGKNSCEKMTAVRP